MKTFTTILTLALLLPAGAYAGERHDVSYIFNHDTGTLLILPKAGQSFVDACADGKGVEGAVRVTKVLSTKGDKNTFIRCNG